MIHMGQPIDGEATWTLGQIDNVRRLWMKARVDRSIHFQTAGAATVETKRRVALAVCDEAKTFGVDAHPDDVQFNRTEDATHITIEGRWHPETRNVELLGGPLDGKVYALERPYEPFRVPRQRTPSLSDFDALDLSSLEVDEYVLTGWRERERRWVMKIAPTS